jgi:hypothetical protein
MGTRAGVKTTAKPPQHFLVSLLHVTLIDEYIEATMATAPFSLDISSAQQVPRSSTVLEDNSSPPPTLSVVVSQEDWDTSPESSTSTTSKRPREEQQNDETETLQLRDKVTRFEESSTITTSPAYSPKRCNVSSPLRSSTTCPNPLADDSIDAYSSDTNTTTITTSTTTATTATQLLQHTNPRRSPRKRALQRDEPPMIMPMMMIGTPSSSTIRRSPRKRASSAPCLPNKKSGSKLCPTTRRQCQSTSTVTTTSCAASTEPTQSSSTTFLRSQLLSFESPPKQQAKQLPVVNVNATSLKPLICKTPLKENGTPMKTEHNRSDNDQTIQGSNSASPSTTADQDENAPQKALIRKTPVKYAETPMKEKKASRTDDHQSQGSSPGRTSPSTTADRVEIVINILPNVNTVPLKALVSKTLLNDDKTPMKNPRSVDNHQIQGSVPERTPPSSTADQVEIVVNILPNMNTIPLKALVSKTLLNDDKTPMKNPRSADNHQSQGNRPERTIPSTTPDQVEILVNILPNVNTIPLKALVSKTLLNDDRTPMKNPRSADNHQIQGITQSPPPSATVDQDENATIILPNQVLSRMSLLFKENPVKLVDMVRLMALFDFRRNWLFALILTSRFLPLFRLASPLASFPPSPCIEIKCNRNP